MKVAASMRDAVITILVADFVMSDNVLGVAAASGKDLRLLFSASSEHGHFMGMG